MYKTWHAFHLQSVYIFEYLASLAHNFSYSYIHICFNLKAINQQVCVPQYLMRVFIHKLYPITFN